MPTTVSGYTDNQTYNPSNTTSWRVFSNDGTNVEIISDGKEDFVKNLLYLNGSIGYVNAVQTLNDISRAFVNTSYAVSARSIGYNIDGLNEEEIANYKVIDTDVYPLDINTEGFPYVDSQYTYDAELLVNYGMVRGVDWLASRYQGTAGYYVPVLWRDDIAPYYRLYCAIMYDAEDGDGFEQDGLVRPIVLLKPNLTITGGSGTDDEPYIINTINPSQYTITYSANGGYGEMNPQSVAQGGSIKLTSNAYEHYGNYVFKGWSTDATATTATYTDGQTITPTADMTLYPVWEEVNYPMMAAGNTWYKGTTGKSNIYEIHIVSSYTPQSTPVESWNADVDNSGSIKCYVEEEDWYYKLTIAGNGSEKILANPDSSYMFSNFDDWGCNGDDLTGLELLDTSNVTTMKGMFSREMGSEYGPDLDLSSFDTSNVTDMSHMFDGFSLTGLNLSSFDTSNVTDMSYMFDIVWGINYIDVSNFDTSNVINMSYMFSMDLYNLDLSNFDTSNVTVMTNIFEDLSNLEEITLGENFEFVGTDCYLPVPQDSYYISGTDGYWYKADGTALTPEGVAQDERTEATTYYATKDRICSHTVETWTYVDNSDIGCQGVCTTCGITVKSAHSWKNGVCTRCGAIYEAPTFAPNSTWAYSSMEVSME